MDERTESIKQEVDETLEDMTHKMEQIEARVYGTARETFESVKHSAQEKVKKVKQKLDIRRVTQQRPWTMFGISVAAGFVAGNLTGRERRRGEPEAWYEGEPEQLAMAEEVWAQEEPERERGFQRRGRARRQREGRGGFLATVKEQFGDEISAFTRAAVVSAGRSVRGFMEQNLPHFAEEFERARKEHPASHEQRGWGEEEGGPELPGQARGYTAEAPYIGAEPGASYGPVTYGGATYGGPAHGGGIEGAAEPTEREGKREERGPSSGETHH